MSHHERLPRWPLRMHLHRLWLSLFGWMSPELHSEYKQLIRENRRLRSEIRERKRSAARSSSR